MMISAVTAAIQPAAQAPDSRAASKPAAPAAAPQWPERHSAGLTGEVLGLKQTELAFTSDDTVFDTGADFWDMLATAIEGEARAAKPGS